MKGWGNCKKQQTVDDRRTRRYWKLVKSERAVEEIELVRTEAASATNKSSKQARAMRAFQQNMERHQSEIHKVACITFLHWSWDRGFDRTSCAVGACAVA